MQSYHLYGKRNSKQNVEAMTGWREIVTKYDKALRSQELLEINKITCAHYEK